MGTGGEDFYNKQDESGEKGEVENKDNRRAQRRQIWQVSASGMIIGHSCPTSVALDVHFYYQDISIIRGSFLPLPSR